jgi:pimeloyl-ACP methyl ester carboxylesterase
MSSAEIRRLKLWQGRIETEVEIAGEGPALVYLHGPWGLGPDRTFVARLAEQYRVFAPKFPGTGKGAPNAIHALGDWHDLVVYYDELFDQLQLDAPALVGHSFGGMIAAEVAATTPKVASRLVLIDPVGLWRDDAPVRNWMLIPHQDRPSSFFADPESEAAKRFFAVPTDADERVETLSQLTWSQACTGKFTWPIADRGLAKRIHRISAPTLVIWGEADGVIAPVYAEEFSKRISDARTAKVARAGHLPHLEQPDAVIKALSGFIAS